MVVVAVASPTIRAFFNCCCRCCCCCCCCCWGAKGDALNSGMLPPPPPPRPRPTPLKCSSNIRCSSIDTFFFIVVVAVVAVAVSCFDMVVDIIPPILLLLAEVDERKPSHDKNGSYRPRHPSSSSG